MTEIYIDYTGSVSLKGKKFHGGSYYSKNLILSLENRICSGRKDFQICVLWPKGYEPQDEYENRIVTSKNITVIEIEKLEDLKGLNENSRIIIPLISIKRWSLFKKIKENNPGALLFVTIHGLRIDDLKFDWYDRFYSSATKAILDGIEIPLKKIYLRYLCKTHLKYVDKIFTVSNFTMQSILKICPVKFIKPYYEGVFEPDINKAPVPDENFALFVSANRIEKNFVRGLEGFFKYKKSCSSDLKLYVTGTNDKLKEKIYKAYADEKELLDECVKFCGYVDNAVLEDYYTQCRFLLYTSKSEGFGLPVLEMALRGKTAVASSITSIPEVLGASVYYVNPYDTDSIAMGIAYMNNDEHLKAYETSVMNLKDGIRNKINVNMDILIYDILN